MLHRGEGGVGGRAATRALPPDGHLRRSPAGEKKQENQLRVIPFFIIYIED